MARPPPRSPAVDSAMPDRDIAAVVSAGRPVKRSLTLRGHRTSVSLEDAFWRGFRDIAALRGVPLNALAAEIDAARGLETGLATAIRLFVLDAYRCAAAPAPR